MPLTPDANLRRVSAVQCIAEREKGGWGVGLLDELLGLDVGHAVHTGDTVTVGVPQSASEGRRRTRDSIQSSDDPTRP